MILDAAATGELTNQDLEDLDNLREMLRMNWATSDRDQEWQIVNTMASILWKATSWNVEFKQRR